MKIAIIGTGGVGGYFGGKLAQAGHDVTFIARGEHLKAIQTNGLKIKSPKGDFTVYPANATDDITTIGTVDLAIIATKAWQVRGFAKELKPFIHENAIVLPLQNGILAHEEISEELGEKHTLVGLCRIFSKIVEPGVIHHMSIEPTIIFGELSNEKTPRVENLLQLFEEAGIESYIPEDIHASLWKKFISICVSGLLAVSKSTYGIARELPGLRQMMRDMLTENFTVSQKAGINLPPDLVDKLMAAYDTFDYNATSSMTRDVMEGKPSEIEYQNGTIVRLGEKYNVDTPVNRFIYNCILPMELKARRNDLIARSSEINAQRPKPFEFYTAEQLWNEPYVSQKMLEMHLAEDQEAASRKKEFLDKSVKWIIDRFNVGAQTEVCDFGCGPGLYTTPFAQTGASVTGIDFSQRSIEYAKGIAKEKNLDIDYIYQNYLEFSTQKRFDLITMIYCDFCVLSPEQRKKLLRIFYETLKDDGSIFMDVFSTNLLKGYPERETNEYSHRDGFWSPGPCYSFKDTFIYPEEKVFLDRYFIVEDRRVREIYNWLQCYVPESLEKEFSDNGFTITERYSDVSGTPYSPGSTEIAIVAKKKK